MTNKPGEFEGRLKEELEKALHEELGGDPYRRSNQLQIHECENIALWAAKWMAERCAEVSDRQIVNDPEGVCADADGVARGTAMKIRQLSKDLSGWRSHELSKV